MNNDSLITFLASNGFTSPDALGSSALDTPNGCRITVLNVDGYEKVVRLSNANRVRLWFVAVHQLPISMVIAIVKQAMEENQ